MLLTSFAFTWETPMTTKPAPNSTTTKAITTTSKLVTRECFIVRFLYSF